MSKNDVDFIMIEEHDEERSEKFLKLSEWVRSTFSLSQSEHVVQDYFCGYYAILNSIQVYGRMFITENYICWRPKIEVQASLVIIPLNQVKEIKKQASKLILPNGLGIFMKDGSSYHFATFNIGKRNEAYEVIEHLNKYPSKFVKPEEKEKTKQEEIEMEKGKIFHDKHSSFPHLPSSSSSSSHSHNNLNKHNSFDNNNNNGNNNNFSSSHGDFSYGGNKSSTYNQMSEEERMYVNEVVDVNSTKRIIKTLNETNSMGSHVLVELDRQSEVLHNVENKLDNIDYHMDVTDRNMRSIESLGGQITNRFRKDPSKKKEMEGENSKKERKWNKLRKEDNTEVPIVYKFKNDSLASSFLVFKEEKFEIYETNKTKLVEKHTSYTYSSISHLSVRARPYHFTIIFDNNIPRLRLMSSYIQLIANEFLVRAPEADRHFNCFFDFFIGIKEIKLETVRSNRVTHNPFDHVSSFTENFKGPENVKLALEEQDKDLNEISNLLVDMENISVTINHKLSEDEKDLERIDHKMDRVKGRVDNTNDRIKKLL